MRWCVVVILMISSVAQADTAQVQVGRYISAEAVASDDQVDPLNVVIEMSFPSHIQTVGEAINNLLLESGYRFADYSVHRVTTGMLLDLPLPRVHRHLGPLPLKDALIVLVGKPYRLVIDPVRRLITFDLRKEYRAFIHPALDPQDRTIPNVAEVQP